MHQHHEHIMANKFNPIQWIHKKVGLGCLLACSKVVMNDAINSDANWLGLGMIISKLHYDDIVIAYKGRDMMKPSEKWAILLSLRTSVTQSLVTRAFAITTSKFIAKFSTSINLIVLKCKILALLVQKPCKNSNLPVQKPLEICCC